MEPRCPKCFIEPCECNVTIAFKPGEPRLTALPPSDEQQEHNRRMSEACENVVSMSTERFKRDTNPNNHSPRTALERALESFDEMPSDKEVTHCIVLFALKTTDGLVGTRFIQAGSADHHGQMGLIAEAQCLLREAE